MRLAGQESGRPVRLPPAGRGQAIGLYGGSFDPPHAGHRHVALTALRRLGLDAVWILVSPGNPLKDRTGLPGVAARRDEARRVFRHPRLVVTDLESRIGARFTVETVTWLARHRPNLRFVWILGADNWAGFHRWRGWRRLAATLSVAVVDRPGWTLRAVAGPAGRRLAARRVPEGAARSLAGRAPPAWTLLHGPRSALSSTALRRAAARRGDAPPLKTS